MVPNREIDLQFFENLNVCGKKKHRRFPPRKLGKLEGVESTLSIERKKQTATVRTAAEVVENGYFDLLRKFSMAMQPNFNECFRLIAKKKVISC